VVAAAIDIYGKIEIKNLQRNLLFGLLGGLLIVSLVGWMYAGRALKPINDIVERMKLISASNLQTRLGEGNRTDEIARLAQTFNKMLTRLENAFNLQKTFVANVSHELKNPLTAITSQLEVSLLREREKGEYQRTLESVLEDIRNLNRAASSLLDLASLNTDRLKIDMAPTRIDELLWACRERLLTNHPEYKIDIQMNLPEDERHLMVLGNDYLLGIAIANLMENGCKFSSDHEIQVTMTHHGRMVEIGFRNQGTAISEEDLPNIFQPFYRGKNQESVTGHGIGLSLVSRIVELHQAQITVTSSKDDGTLFSISIPHVTF
jgi:signal transduction histidine kinase